MEQVKAIFSLYDKGLITKVEAKEQLFHLVKMGVLWPGEAAAFRIELERSKINECAGQGSIRKASKEQTNCC